MPLHRRSLLAITPALAAALSFGRLSHASSRPARMDDIHLWPGDAPGGEGVTVTPEVVERSTDPAFHDRIAKHTRDPLLTVVRPVQPNGVSLLLIPGGGYRWAVVDKEGMDCARVFAAMGYTCYVLRYRLPADGWAAGPDAPLQDAQRALRLVRAHAPPAKAAPRIARSFWAPRPEGIWRDCSARAVTPPTPRSMQQTRIPTGPTL